MPLQQRLSRQSLPTKALRINERQKSSITEIIENGIKYSVDVEHNQMTLNVHETDCLRFYLF